MRGFVVVVLCLSACGRRDFDPRDATVADTSSDAPSPIAAAFEVESGQISSPFQIVLDPAASGGSYVLDGNGLGLTGPGRDLLSFDVANLAAYYIWARTRSPDPSSDSFFLSLDGAATIPFDTSECVHDLSWHWVALRFFSANCPMIGATVALTITAGAHTLALSSREGQSAIDRIVITADPAFVPTD